MYVSFSSGFPGAQPVSMDTNNIMFIRQKPYRVSWKADGTRYYVYTTLIADCCSNFIGCCSDT